MSHLEPDDILYAMRSQRPLSDAQIDAFIGHVVGERMSRPQIGAWLAWAFQRGLTDAETIAYTRAMTYSGDVLTWPEGSELIDKHSTGGVGDKVSLVLAPLWAALGKRVPMISGRGLGLTGGTLDKLESIPGYRTDLDVDALRAQLATVGCFISGQTASLAPADRVLYALRNETCTVPSIPLIVGSILSKKLAEGVQTLVLDVKCGTGAFMETLPEAEALAQQLVRVATGYGVRCRAFVTNMASPLGDAVGNALEVVESIDCLRGGGPADLRALVLALANDPRAASLLDSGAALPYFTQMIEAQGGDPRVVEAPERLLGEGCVAQVITATRDGFVQRVDAGGVGRAAFVLGAGRRRAEDPVDFGVGLCVHARVGDAVSVGQPLATVYHRDGRSLERALEELASGLLIGDEPVAAPTLVLRAF